MTERELIEFVYNPLTSSFYSYKQTVLPCEILIKTDQ